MYQYLNKQEMTIFGDGIRLEPSFIDDSLEPIWNSAVKIKASKQIINLGVLKKFH